MATAGSITIDLLARTGSFTTDMDRARKKVGEFDNDLKGMVARLDRAAIAIAGVAAGAAAGMVALTMQTVKTMDATSKMADQIGVTTEALTGLRFAAQQFANVSDQTFDMALRRMTRRIEEAAQGSGGAKAAFEAMGLSAKELARLSADQQFMRIADAMQKTDTQAQRLKNTMAIFDTEGMPLVNALSQGSKELERNIELATRYGVVLSTEAARSAEQLTDNLSRLSSIQDGMRQQLTTAMLPALERLSGYMLGVAESALEVGNSRHRLEEFSRVAVEFVDDLARSYAGLTVIGRGVLDMLAELDAAALDWLKPFKTETVAATTILTQSFSESILNTAREIDKLVGLAGGVMAVWETVGGNIPLYFRLAWNKVLEGAATFVNSLAGLVNPMLETLGMDGFGQVAWGENVVVGLRSISESFREGYESAKDASGMAARVQAAYDGVAASAAKATPVVAGLGSGLSGTSKASDAARKAAEAFRKEQERALVAQYQSISAIHAQAQGIEDQVALFGLSKSALEDLTIARLEEEAVVLRMYGDRSKAAVEAIEAEIEARKRLRTAIGSLEQKEAERASWQEWARDVEQIFNRVGQSLTDAIFDGGKSGKELLKDVFKGLTFNVLINPVMGAMQGWVTNQLGGMFGYSDPRQGGGSSMLGMAQNAYSGYNAATGGLSSNLGNAAQWLGQKVGSEALTSFGLGLSGTTAATGIASIGAGLGASLGTTIGTSAAAMTTTTFSAAMGGGALIPGLGVGAAGGGVGAGIGAAGAAAGGAAAGGAAGFGAAVGAALPWIGGALAIGGLLGGGLFDREPTTRREQRTQVEYAGGALDITKRDDRAQAGADQAVAQMTAAAVQSANSLFQQIGVDAAIDSFHAIMASSYKGDRDGVASGGMLRLGDELRQFGIDLNDPNPTIQGFGGWSSAETLPRLATDIQLSVLEAFQSVSDQLPGVLSAMLEGIDVRSLGEQEAQALAERFTLLTQGASQFLAAIDAMPFAELRDLTFDAAAGMVQFAGGIDNLLSAQQTYYERFYSDAERHGHAVDQLTQALAGVGVEMPALVGSTDDMLASYRALVESLDLNTEAGQQAYVTLMQAAGAFADVAEFAGQAAVEAARYAEQVLREREGLERQLLQLQGNTVELRRRELEALDESNRALQERIWALQDQRQLASAERRDELAARRAAEEREREAFDAAVKSYEDGAKAFDDLRQTLLSAGDAAGLLGATIERALSNPNGKYMAGGVEYDQPRWGVDTTAAGFNYDWGVMQMRLARDLSNDVSANALRIENAGAALRDLSPNLGEYSPVVGPLAQALTAAVVDASGDIGYAVRDSVYQAMLGVAQQDVYSQFASQGPGLADIRYAQQQAGFASQAGWVAGMGMQFGADVVAYGNALDKLAGRMQSGQITAEQFDAAVETLNRTMPDAAELLGDTEAQLQRMADAAHDVAMAGARSIDHYFGELRKMAQELEKTEEPINKATAAIGRMNSWVSAFGESAQAAGEYSKRTGEAALIAQAAGIAASVLTTADARKAAEELAKDAAFAGVGGAELRDMSLLVDGIKAFNPDSWENAFIRISDALGQGVIDEGQFAALFNYSLDVFEDTARTTQQLEQSFDRLRDAAGSLADELLLDRDLTTLSFGQQYSEAQRQYQEVMRRAMSGDVDAAGDLDRVTRNFLERSADSRDEIQYRRDFAVAVNSLRQIERSNPVVDEIKRLNSEVEGLRADLREANAQIAANTGKTVKRLDRIIIEDTAV